MTALTSAEPVLSASGLSAGYGRLEVLSDVTLEVGPGETVALLGANGAGKSTFLNTVAGVIKPRRGQVRFTGTEVTAARPRKLVDLGLGYVAEGRRLFKSLSVEDNLVLGLHRSRCSSDEVKQRLESSYDLFPVLATRRTVTAGSLSGGQQQSLAIAQGLICRPRLLVIDELSFGLAPAIVDEVLEVLIGARAHVGAMLIVEQAVDRVLGIADRIYVLRAGRVSDSGDAPAFRDEERLNSAYFGSNPAASAIQPHPPGPPGEGGPRPHL